MTKYAILSALLPEPCLCAVKATLRFGEMLNTVQEWMAVSIAGLGTGQRNNGLIRENSGGGRCFCVAGANQVLREYIHL